MYQFIDLLFDLLQHFLENSDVKVDASLSFERINSEKEQASIKNSRTETINFTHLLEDRLSSCLNAVILSNLKEEKAIERLKLATKRLWSDSFYTGKISSLCRKF